MSIEQHKPPRKRGISEKAMDEASRHFDELFEQGETGSVTVDIESGTTDKITVNTEDRPERIEFIEDAGDYLEG